MSEGIAQRQGSQDLGTMQSQLAIEQETVRNTFLHTLVRVRGTSFSSGCYTSTSNNTDRPEGPDCESKSRTDQSCASEAWWTLGW